MNKTLLITGATDGIGLATATQLASQEHRILLHGRNPEKLHQTVTELSRQFPQSHLDTFQADLSRMDDVLRLASEIRQRYQYLDVLINNAGIFQTTHPIADNGLDVRFMVNTLAPYVLTRQLLPCMDADSRIINIASAAQASIDPEALKGHTRLDDAFQAYAQSKLALIIWTQELAYELGTAAPAMIALNPGSLLGSKMVKEGFGVAGGDLSTGADIITRAALASTFANVSGQYFDNDNGQFAPPHQDALNLEKSGQIMTTIEQVALRLGG